MLRLNQLERLSTLLAIKSMWITKKAKNKEKLKASAIKQLI